MPLSLYEIPLGEEATEAYLLDVFAGDERMPEVVSDEFDRLVRSVGINASLNLDKGSVYCPPNAPMGIDFKAYLDAAVDRAMEIWEDMDPP